MTFVVRVIVSLLAIVPLGWPRDAACFVADTLGVVRGQTDGQHMGVSVAPAGDINGDSYEDLIVGGHGGPDGGNAFVYLGGPGFDEVSDLRMKAYHQGDEFGICVAGIGDFNGDGYDDWAVGARRAANDNGRIYLHFGGSFPDTIPDLVLTGESGKQDEFGWSVGPAGDFNGDGFPDVVAGAVFSDAGAVNGGRAYVFFGGSSPNAIADVILTGTMQNGLFGHSVANLGDINGDSCSDIAIGAPGSASLDGRAYIFLGGVIPNTTPDAVLAGSVPEEEFGYAVSSVGDVDRDGHDDIAVGAPFNTSASGRVYVYNGASFNSAPIYVLTSPVSYDYFGVAVSSAGDVNGDGRSDVLVGADDGCIQGPQTGRAYLFLSEMGGIGGGDLVGIGSVGACLGSAVSRGVDLNGDGRPEIVVAAPRESSGGTYRGAVYVLSPTSTTGVPETLIPPDVTTLKSVWPNPVRSGQSINVVVEGGSPYWVFLVDVSGRVRRSSFEQTPGQVSSSHMNVHDLESGTYFVRVASIGTRYQTRKVLLLE